ncbi:MAG: hypothetical protein A2Z88_09485 [Omnitrophica WOR_2 bacterium GWA2_47_8]|nr:MAG: hypothetical protein A2Z88_09485 [Omnitrophica WOR_2 bacterium GWA2_47_8]
MNFSNIKNLVSWGLFLFGFSISNVCAQTFEEYFNKGMEAYNQGQYESASKFLNQALDLDENSAKIYNALGLVYRNQNAPLDDVVWYFKVAIDIDPDYFEAYQNLGELYFRTNNFKEAEEYLLQALRINPEAPSVQYTLAWVYLNGLSRPDEAIYYFQKILDKGDIPQAQYGIGLAYVMKNEPAFVLERITALRDKGHNDFASQLEAAIRKDYTAKPAELPGIPPPPAQLPPQQPVAAAPVEIQGPSGSMRVRLKGKMYSPGIGNQPSQQPPAKVEYKAPPVPPAAVLKSGY